MLSYLIVEYGTNLPSAFSMLSFSMPLHFENSFLERLEFGSFLVSCWLDWTVGHGEAGSKPHGKVDLVKAIHKRKTLCIGHGMGHGR